MARTNSTLGVVNVMGRQTVCLPFRSTVRLLKHDAHHGVGFSDSQMVSDSQMGGAACVKHDAQHGVGFSDSQMVSDSQMGEAACVKHDAQHGVGFSDSQMVSDSQILGWCR